MIPKRRTDNMYRNLVLYRNELKNTVVPRYKTIGIVAELLMSKEIFSKNTEISDFLSAVFSTKYKDYVMKSRTLIIARCCRIVLNCEEKDYAIYKKKLFQFVNVKIETLKREGGIKKEKNQFDGWMS